MGVTAEAFSELFVAGSKLSGGIDWVCLQKQLVNYMSHTVKFHFVTIKHVVLSFKL